MSGNKSFFPQDSARGARGSLAFSQASPAAHAVLSWESPHQKESKLCLPASLSSPVPLYCTANRSNGILFMAQAPGEGGNKNVFSSGEGTAQPGIRGKELRSEKC